MAYQNSWLDLIPTDLAASAQEKTGDIIVGRIDQQGGSGQVAAIGKNISQNVRNQLGNPTPDDIDAIRELIKELKSELPSTGMTQKDQGKAELQLEQIEEELSKPQEKADLGVLKRATGWLKTNVPSGVKFIAKLFMSAAVGRILAGHGDEILLWVRHLIK